MNAVASLWLRACRENHSSCPSAWTTSDETGNSFRPTRLLDITQPGFVRLASGADPTMSKQYTTMSHCWGQIELYTLTKDTYADLSKGISTSELTKTFQEGLKVAQGLGFEAMWIDSLCIFQDKDDLTDWQRECSRMADVYQHSACNIAATAGQDGTNGCFSNMGDPCLAWPPITRVSLVKENYGSDDQILDGWYHLVTDSFLKVELTQQPLCTRGWVVQERILAPRTLHFSARQMFWECSSNFVCESFPSGFPDELDGMASAKPARKLLIKSEAVNKDARDKYWASVVMDYSGCFLTKETDKLVAISGVAKLVQREFEDEYLAGHWHSSLFSSLLWRMTYDPSREVTEKEEFYPYRAAHWYRAPSWSWASIDDAVLFLNPGSDYNAVAEIISCTTQPRPGSETMGQLLGGTLRIRGPVFDIDYLESHPKARSRSDPLCRTGDNMPCMKVRGTMDNRQELEEHLTEERSIPVLVLLYNSKSQNCYGIILWKRSGEVGEYRRIGVVAFQLIPADYFHYGKPKSFPNFRDEPDVGSAYLKYVTKEVTII
ncbi:heterokaryon incompatibility protein-domain-containing protein [Bisporella sp. PMI_857]|nr:heterokaryon incompatibility protein-domain-containing protein [Bisporella sp. PMI_857]